MKNIEIAKKDKDGNKLCVKIKIVLSCHISN